MLPGERAVGIRAVSMADPIFIDHFPGNPVLPGVYVVEGLAQTAGVLLWESSSPQRVALMSSIDRAKFSSFARPGESVRFDVKIESIEERHARIHGEASVDGRAIATVRLTFMMLEPTEIIPANLLPFWEQGIDLWMGRFPGRDAV